MNNELNKYSLVTFSAKSNNDYDTKELYNRLTFLENRQQNNTKIIGDTRDNICDMYGICQLLQETLKITSNKIDK